MLLCGLGRATDLPAPFILDFPIAPGVTTPSWLGAPEIPSTQFASLNLPVLTPDPQASLLVTVYFQEKDGGFMRIIWNGTQGAQQLSGNFYEGIGMANQRSLLISPETLVGDGTLTFQCGDTVLGIERIKFEWLENRNGLVSPLVTDTLVTAETQPTQKAQNLSGQTIPPGPGTWQDQLVTVPITDEALRIEEGVDFNVQLDNVPTVARLALEEAGLPFGQRIVVWVNQQRAGTITPTVPDLLDSGFMAAPSGTVSYAGWRDGSFFIPVALLKQGGNAFQFSIEDDASSGGSGSSSTTPLALKGVVLQLDYAPLQTPAPAATPAVVQPQAEPQSAPENPTQNTSQPFGPIPPSTESTTEDWTSPGAISAQSTSTSTNTSP